MQICQHYITLNLIKTIRAKLSQGLFVGIIIVAISFFYWIGTGNIQLFDWDEINFAQISREMFLRDNCWQSTINFLPFHEKPPLFNWFQLLGFKLFGVNEMSARLPNIICATLTLACLFYIGRIWRSNLFGWWWMFFMAFSLLPQLYFRSGIIDPWFNLFIFLGLATSLAKKEAIPTFNRIMAAGLLLGLGVLTKGPVAVLIAGLCLGIYLLSYQSVLFKHLWWRYTLIGFIGLLPTLLWVAYVWTLDGGYFAREFLVYQWRLFSQPDAGHGGFPGFHVVVLLLGCFPASIFAFPRLFGGAAHPPERLMRLLFWVVLLLFSIVSTKIVHYSSLAYFPITFLAAARAEQLFHGGQLKGISYRLGQWIWGFYALLLLIIPLVIHCVLPFVSFHDLDYRSSKVFPSLSALYLPFLAIPALWIWWHLRQIARRENWLKYASWQLIGATYFGLIGLLCYIGPIQELSQGSYVAFYRKYAAEKPYFGTAYHKSYAPLYYGAVDLENGGRPRTFRFHGPTTRPLYFSSPLARKAQVLREVPDAKWLYSEGGYSFYVRPPAAKAD